MNTLIDTFFSKLCTLLAGQRRTRKANDGDGTVDEFLADPEIYKSDTTVHNL